MDSTRLATRLKRACLAARLSADPEKKHESMLAGKTGRGSVCRSLGMLLVTVGLFVHPTTAGATPITFTLLGSSFDAVSEGGTALVGQGFFTAGTMITLSGGPSGTVTGLALPGLSGGGVSYSFAAPSGSITYTLNSATGALDFTNSIIASVTRSGPTTVGVTNPLTLTTGTTNAGSPCGGLGATPVHGSPANLTTGAVTVVGGTCVPADAGAGGPWLVQVKLIGNLSPPVPVPEPGTAVLLGCGLGGIALAVARRQPRRARNRLSQRRRRTLNLVREWAHHWQ